MALTTWEMGLSSFPHHFNLAIREQVNNNKCESASPSNAALLQAERLRQQNRHLSQDLHLKNDRIKQLEQEKEALIRAYQRQHVSVRHSGSPVCSSSSGGLGDADVVY